MEDGKRLGARRLTLWARDPDIEYSLEDRIQVLVEDESDFEPEIKAKIMNLTWNLANLDESSMLIEVQFEHPELIGSDGSKQYLHILADFGDFEPMWDESEPLMSLRIPQ